MFVNDLNNKQVIKLYNNHNLKIIDIIKNLNCSRSTFNKKRKSLKLIIRKKLIKQQINKNLAIQMYFDKMSSYDIGIFFNVSNVSILNWFREWGVQIKNCSEAQKALKNVGKKNPNYKHGKCCNENYCVDCGRKIDKIGRSIRCYKCSGNYYCGKKHHGYIHGNGNNYPKIFSYKLKNKIRKRDNHICQHCRITEEKHLIKYNTILHVHHIDYNKENCNENNLITLCSICNQKANANRDYWFAYYSYLIKEIYYMNIGELHKVVREEKVK